MLHMVILDIFLLLLVAIALGAIVGLLPGMNPLLGLLLILPVIGENTPVWLLLIFWACYITVTQYYGSVSALLFKVPGETSSLPVLEASKTIKGTRATIRALRLTAASSLIASVIGILGLAIVFWTLRDSWAGLFSISFTVFFLSVVIVILVMRDGRYLLNLALMLTGVLLANISDIHWFNNMCGQQSWTCFTLKPTDVGLAIICLYAVPYMFVKSDHFDARVPGSDRGITWKSSLIYWPIATKHGLLGWLMGFVPGMGVPLSSNTSAALEARQNRPRRLAIMSAAESANNSSVISCTIPFLMIGLPITSTELLLDNWLLVNKAVNINANMIYSDVSILGTSAPFWVWLILGLIITSFCSFYLTSRFVGVYQILNRIPSKVFGWLIKILILFFIVVTIQSSGLTSGSTVFTLLFFSGIGIWAMKKGRDIIALPISIMIGSYAIEKFSIAFQLWS